ncbi:uncharacterized protein LOC109724625 [Ananas comosus]|uniref:Uncharacterized protein LOC109724625 n=1 Tax=Ananas comosus TaxID=4615 RepID=A0A199V313_ANACO|nr:uncharacterized protein LOC109724625 [Ananas comosus]OAY71472.1 hypothetical protein ACMD2_02762 [Ananas comosus]
MAADVSSVARMLRGYAEEGEAERELVTRDLLGGGGGSGAAAAIGGEEVDLDVKVPSGWERRLDLMSGRTYLTPRHVHDLNFPPPYYAAAATAAAADFNLFSPSVDSAAAAFSSSVCTLDKVRCALERAAAAANRVGSASPSPSSATTSTASPSPRHRQSPRGDTNTEMRAAACPACLTYVLIASADPRCPRCDSHVPALSAAPPPQKKPRIDLNAAAAADETD